MFCVMCFKALLRKAGVRGIIRCGVCLERMRVLFPSEIPSGRCDGIARVYFMLCEEKLRSVYNYHKGVNHERKQVSDAKMHTPSLVLYLLRKTLDIPSTEKPRPKEVQRIRRVKCSPALNV